MSKAIYLQISHGLGNQLFQYAMGRAASLRTGLPLKLDLRTLNAQPKTKYEFGNFAMAVETAHDWELPPTRERKIAHRFYKLKSAFTGQRIIESRNAFDDRALRPPPGAWLRGYWQSERYFQDVADQIREDLEITDAPSAQDRRVEAQIKAASPAVSIHVRRADYASLADYFTSLGPDYYTQAVAALGSVLGDAPTFFLFSDDIAWAREALELPGKTIAVDHNDGQTAHQDMRLMSLCDHHVIANSTFSWWGAWLNPSPSKNVVTPELWYAPDWLRSDLINPLGWMKIPIPVDA